jgi:hypothetical protein
MEVNNSVVPNQEQITRFFEPGPEGPIYWVNLLKFKDKAEYGDGRPTELTGRKAHSIYGAAMFAADVERLTLDEVEERCKPRRQLNLETTAPKGAWLDKA